VPLQAKAQTLAIVVSHANWIESITCSPELLDLLPGLPDGPWRRQQELDLQIALRPALAFTKGFSAADVGDTIARARTLAEELDRREHLVPLTFGQWVFA
jgi:hypothetical protein